MQRVLAIAAGWLLLANAAVGAQVTSPVPLDGSTVVLPECRTNDCVAVSKLIYDYAAEGDDRRDVIGVDFHCNPWRMYGPDGRILTVSRVAKMIRSDPSYPNARRVELKCSWSAVRPAGAAQSLAEKVGSSLGKPTTGEDGFVWMGPKAVIRTTHQSFTAYPGVYRAHRGEFVMVSAAYAMADGLPAELENRRDAVGLRYVGLYEDIFLLKPERALNRFELSARYGDNIAAYNAAVMLLERNGKGDRTLARTFAQGAATRGDGEARELLAQMR